MLIYEFLILFKIYLQILKIVKEMNRTQYFSHIFLSLFIIILLTFHMNIFPTFCIYIFYVFCDLYLSSFY